MVMEEVRVQVEKELLKGNTPTLVLAILRDGPLHGGHAVSGAAFP